MLLRIKAIRKKKKNLEQRDIFLRYNTSRKPRRAGVEQNLAGPLQMGVVEAAARCSHGQLAAQDTSTTKPSKAKVLSLPRSPFRKGWKSMGWAEEGSQADFIENIFAGRSAAGSTLQGDKRWICNCFALTGLKQDTSLHLS